MSTLNISELYNNCLSLLTFDDDVFVECVEVLDGINQILAGKRVYDMDEFDDYFYGCKASTLLKNIDKDFNINDNYFYEDENIYSIDDKVLFYRELIDPEELLDNLIDEFDNICWNNYRFMKEFEIAFTELCTCNM